MQIFPEVLEKSAVESFASNINHCNSHLLLRTFLYVNWTAGPAKSSFSAAEAFVLMVPWIRLYIAVKSYFRELYSV